MSEHTTASESTITEGTHPTDSQPNSRTLKAPALIPVNSSFLHLLADSADSEVEGELDGVYSSNNDGGSDSQGTLAIEEEYYHQFPEPRASAIPGDYQNSLNRKTIGDRSRESSATLANTDDCYIDNKKKRRKSHDGHAQSKRQSRRNREVSHLQYTDRVRNRTSQISENVQGSQSAFVDKFRGRKYEGICVLDERNVRDGKDEVCKQFLVQHWVDAKDINACKLPRKSTTSQRSQSYHYSQGKHVHEWVQRIQAL